MSSGDAIKVPLRCVRKGFDEKRGLWFSDGPGHTRSVADLSKVHSAVLSANRLMQAAQLGVLNHFPLARIFKEFQALQSRDGSDLHGCFKWYAEEPAPEDTNAAFFIGLNLILLRICYKQELDPSSHKTLQTLLEELFVWFERESAGDSAYYPNKFMGDLVCAWLLHEELGFDSQTEILASRMNQAADYWLESPWGWGEHMSDIYATVMLNELSALLLFSRLMPKALERKYQKLFLNLIAIEDAFDGGPRVPVIRGYAFDKRPIVKSFRATVTSWKNDGEVTVDRGKHFNFGHLFHKNHWHELAGPVQPMCEHIEIDCYRGAKARAWVTEKNRMGTLSRWPIMPDTEHANWGLSWQTMPLAFAAGEDGWGFLRWQTREGGRDRSHPARNQKAAYLNNALTDAVAPPIVGLTNTLQRGGSVCALRRMPALSRSWEILSDELVLTGSAFSNLHTEVGPERSRLVFEVHKVPVTVFYFSMGSGLMPSLREEGGEKVWALTWSSERLKSIERTSGVWMIAWGQKIACSEVSIELRSAKGKGGSPTAQAEQWVLGWPTPQGRVEVVVEPQAAQPLREAEA